ncbi:ABC transporter ATP-binding protein [Acholeplasma equifetale]|uniref:ABC transporter ATP-binding protein n=1 Tax=Acholeplasma equifetale TaxID=264634 RepID=UPI00047A5DA0|nr:ABC transporter ATP-binding protein [Acholeplasma equifetale]
MRTYIKALNLSKIYKVGEVTTHALKEVNFEIQEGELVVVLGPSGAGKTTLLNLLGGMDNASDGILLIDDKDISKFKEKQLTLYRRHDVGFVFQFYNLMSNLTAKENVELATEIKKDALKVEDILKLVGLENRMHNFPSQLSGGEQQRVSIARAVAKNPKMLLCDEPTGALDYETGKSILKLLSDIARNQHKTVIIVTHNSAIKHMADRVIYIKNGQIDKVEINENPMSIDLIEW